jgi:hypothetical protein
MVFFMRGRYSRKIELIIITTKGGAIYIYIEENGGCEF